VEEHRLFGPWSVKVLGLRPSAVRARLRQGVPLPLVDVGKWDPNAFHCLQWESKELDLSQGCQDIEADNDATRPTIHHHMVELGTRHMC
jgi:hypothetical protein